MSNVTLHRNHKGQILVWCKSATYEEIQIALEKFEANEKLKINQTQTVTEDAAHEHN